MTGKQAGRRSTQPSAPRLGQNSYSRQRWFAYFSRESCIYCQSANCPANHPASRLRAPCGKTDTIRSRPQVHRSQGKDKSASDKICPRQIRLSKNLEKLANMPTSQRNAQRLGAFSTAIDIAAIDIKSWAWITKRPRSAPAARTSRRPHTRHPNVPACLPWCSWRPASPDPGSIAGTPIHRNHGSLDVYDYMLAAPGKVLMHRAHPTKAIAGLYRYTPRPQAGPRKPHRLRALF